MSGLISFLPLKRARKRPKKPSAPRAFDNRRRRPSMSRGACPVPREEGGRGRSCEVARAGSGVATVDTAVGDGVGAALEAPAVGADSSARAAGRAGAALFGR